MIESIPSVLARMMLPELEKLQSHLVKGEVLVTNQNQRKMIDEELHKTIAKRKETLETSELRKEVLMPKRIRNTRGLINMEKSTRKLVQKQESGPVESKHGQMEPEVEKPEVKSGWSQNESKPDVEPEVRMDPKLGPTGSEMEKRTGSGTGSLKMDTKPDHTGRIPLWWYGI